MTRKELIGMIRDEIQDLAFETLRTAKSTDKKEKTYIKPRGLTEDELEYALFYGGNKPNKDGTINNSVFIKEGYEGIPKINSSDITEFEDSFENFLQEIDGASVVFDTQSNGYSLKMWIGPDGIEAGASGIIEMGSKGKIKWAYSLKNGLNISMEDLIVDSGNKRVLEKLYNNYNDWQKSWREKLTISPVESTQQSTPDSIEDISSTPAMSDEEGVVPAA